MEQIQGVDVSWMTHGNPKDKTNKPVAQEQRSSPRQSPDLQGRSPVSSTTPTPNAGNVRQTAPPAPAASTTTPKPVEQPRPSPSRSNSSEKNAPPIGTSPQRRNSWFSNISSKFSGGNAVANNPSLAGTPQTKQAELSIPKPNPARNAVLQHATKHEGQGPYIPAPPKSSQGGILHVFRRLSSNSGLSPGVRISNHGLVERKVLNVNAHRERCPIKELHEPNLRKVAFSVDVEIAPMPKYTEPNGIGYEKELPGVDRSQKRRLSERGEGEALKYPKAIEQQKEELGEVKATGEALPKQPAEEGTDVHQANEAQAGSRGAPVQKTPDTRKKEKKKKSEEERKARKEKKRRLAEANGTIPIEIHADSDSSGSSSADAPRPQYVPTTNPARIYRRCCQLRETPILKRVTEQLMDPANFSADTGMVEKLDLTGYWMQFGDLVTLGDYLAVVAVKEVVLENCGLTDEGLRMVLAGLLAAKKPEPRRRRKADPDAAGKPRQGGVVECLVLRNNKLGPRGWEHLCLFIYHCRSLKVLNLSRIPFPDPTRRAGGQAAQANGGSDHLKLSRLLSSSLAERLGGSTLGLLNLGDTGMNTQQLEVVLDGITKCGIRRIGLARNNIDAQGVGHVARYLRDGKCDGLDLCGNDMGDQMEVLADALADSSPLAALNLAECELGPSSLCKLLPKLTTLPDFRFIDLSHNHDLFASEPSAVSVLRRYLPKFPTLKRIHFADCAITSEQAIALAEVLPEIPRLAHISFLENPELVRLTNAKTEEAKEEACALFTSLLAAARLSNSLVCIDMEVPSEQSSEVIKAIAKQVVAYCLRNLERLPMSEFAAATLAQNEPSAVQDPAYPDVLQHLVGRDILSPSEIDDVDDAPNDDYVIGGTGVVKALTCCLKNSGDESARQPGELVPEPGDGVPQTRSDAQQGKAKDMSKHLLLTARKIRKRLQPPLAKAKEVSKDDAAYNRLLFLDHTLEGIIKRFEDEFPETREESPGVTVSATSRDEPSLRERNSTSSSEAEVLPAATVSDGEDEPETSLRSPTLSRSSSAISLTSKALSDEEARVLRAGHKFRLGIVKPEAYNALLGVEMVGADPKHKRILRELLVELGDEELVKKADEIGVMRLFREEKDRVLPMFRTSDPDHWERFALSQEMAKKNVNVDPQKCTANAANSVAVEDDEEPRPSPFTDSEKQPVKA